MAAIEHNCECGENLWIITERTSCGGCPYNTTDGSLIVICIRDFSHNDKGCYLLTCKTCSAEDYIPRIG